MQSAILPAIRTCRPAWNKGHIVGRKRPLLPQHVWAIRVRMEIAAKARDLALFNLAIDSKLRGCDLVALKVADVFTGGRVKEYASIIQRKRANLYGSKSPKAPGHRGVAREFDDDWAGVPVAGPFPRTFTHLDPAMRSIVREWVTSIGLEPSAYGTYSMRRTKVAQSYRRTGNLRAVQLLLGHTKMDSTVRYLGVELEDALAISEAVEI